MKHCEPNDQTTEPCEHLVVAREAAETARAWAERARATADRLFTSNEVKIFNSFFAVSIFLLVALLFRRNDIGLLAKQPDGSSLIPYTLRGPFIAGILIHHCRLFLGLSYSEERREEKGRTRTRVAWERRLRGACAFTFPLFSIFLFDRSPEAIITVSLVWLLQLVCIIFYNFYFLTELVPEGHKLLIIWASDVTSALFGLGFFLLPSIDILLASETGLRATGVLGTILILPIAVAAFLIAVAEFCIVYARRVWWNLRSVFLYFKGEALSATNT